MPNTLLKKPGKGQVQLFETIGVLFVFFFLLMFGLIFYSSFQKESLNDIDEEKKELELVSLAQTISSLPELKCSEQKSIKETCFDLLSFKVLTDKMDEFMTDDRKRLYFYSLFRSSNITLDVFYMDEEDMKDSRFKRFEMYYNNEENLTGVRTNYVPITVRDPTNGELYFGVLYLTIFTE